MKEKTNKKKIVFTEEDKENIISKYKSGLSGQKIADEYGCSEITIRRFLRSNNITAKDNPHNIFIDDLPNEDKQYIIDSYLNGMGANKLAEKYNCNEGAIRNFLKHNNITYKDAKHYHLKNFSDIEIDDIINKYKLGITITDLSKEYKSNYKTIKKLIPGDVFLEYKTYKYNGNKFRSYKNVKSDEKEQIANKYLNGVFRKALSQEYDLSIATIDKILREFDINGENNPNWDKQKKKFNKNTKEQIVKLYKDDNYLQSELANMFNCSRDYIKSILYEFNCSYKDNLNYHYNISETLIDKVDDIIDLYSKNISISKLSQMYNVGNKVIADILRNNNIHIKQSDEYTNYTEEELLDFLKEIYEEYGYVNTVLLNTLEGYPTSNTYTNRFGLFGNAMEKAELPYDSSIIMLDDEICKSGFEYRLSLVLRKYNIKYDRDYLYKYIVPNYHRNHSIDYKVYYNNNIIYLEIFGMCNSTFSNRKYNETKEMKIKLLASYNIPFISLYPEDFKLVNRKFEEHILDKINNMIYLRK